MGHRNDEGQRQQHIAGGDESEQEAFERKQRRQRIRAQIGQAAMQTFFERHQHQRLQGGDDQQRVGKQRNGDVQGSPRFRDEGKPVQAGANALRYYLMRYVVTRKG